MALEDDIARGVKQGIEDFHSEQRWKKKKEEAAAFSEFLEDAREKQRTRYLRQEAAARSALRERTYADVREKYGDKMSPEEIRELASYEFSLNELRAVFGAKKKDKTLINKLAKLERLERYTKGAGQKVVTVVSMVLFGLTPILVGFKTHNVLLGVITGGVLAFLMYLFPTVNTIKGIKKGLSILLKMINLGAALFLFCAGVSAGDFIITGALMIGITFGFFWLYAAVEDSADSPDHTITGKVNAGVMRKEMRRVEAIKARYNIT